MNFTSYETVKQFEKTIAKHTGAKFAVAVDSCTNAIFLCLKYLKADIVYLPKFTYPGVACSVIHSGAKIIFTHNHEWKGIYKLSPLPIYDCALRFQKNMYIKDSFMCLSFHSKKHIPIGRGGMILCDSLKAVDWIKRARFDGRNACPILKDKIKSLGWNMYMTPEQAARGLMLFEVIKNKKVKDIDMKKQGYCDLSKIGAYQ